MLHLCHQQHLRPNCRGTVQSSKRCVPDRIVGRRLRRRRCLSRSMGHPSYAPISINALLCPSNTAPISLYSPCCAANGGDGVKITYPNGSGGLCSGLPRVSYILVYCDARAGDGVIDNVTESQSVPCQYTITYGRPRCSAWLLLALTNPVAKRAVCAPSGLAVALLLRLQRCLRINVRAANMFLAAHKHRSPSDCRDRP